MPIRFLNPVNIFAQRISYQSTCVKIRTTFSVRASSFVEQETKSDYYSEEFSIRTSGKISSNCSTVVGGVSYPSISALSSSSSSSPVVSSSGSQFIEEAENRMPVVAAVVAHRRVYPAAASSLASSTAGSQRSSCAATARHLSAVSFVSPMPLGLTGIIKRGSHYSASKYSAGSGTVTTKSVGGGGGLVHGRSGTGRPLVELQQLGRLLNVASPPLKGATILVESRRSYAKGKDKPKSKKTNVVFNEDEVGEVIDVANFKKQLEKLVEQMKEEYTTQLSIRGAAGALESLQVEFEGEVYPLQELAQVGRKNPQLAILNLASLPDAIKPVLKAIEESGMNLNPQQEGTTIYVPLPKVTREHRETLAKNAKALFMKYKVALQGVQNKYIKQCKNQKDLSEDLIYSVTQQLMKYTDSVISESENLMHLKQKELLDNK